MNQTLIATELGKHAYRARSLFQLLDNFADRFFLWPCSSSPPVMYAAHQQHDIHAWTGCQLPLGQGKPAVIQRKASCSILRRRMRTAALLWSRQHVPRLLEFLHHGLPWHRIPAVISPACAIFLPVG
jgi:hypothetical protein